MGAIPAGFEPMPPLGRFHERSGPIYEKRVPGGLIAGLLIDARHENRGGSIHGGMLTTFIDSAFAYAVRWSQDPPIRGVTTSLAIEFIGSAGAGEWIEAHVDVVRSGKRLVFLNCFVWRGEERIARASATFQVVGKYDADESERAAGNP
jgi:uncharacterized protein (TIGR00369 family)